MLEQVLLTVSTGTNLQEMFNKDVGTLKMQVDLSHCNLQGVVIPSGVEFTHTSFENALLNGANLEHAAFAGCRFNGQDLNSFKWAPNAHNPSKGIFNSSPTLAAHFVGVQLKRIDLRGRDLSQVSFASAILHEVILKNADLQNSNWWGVDFRLCRPKALKGANLQGSFLYGAHLEEKELQNVNLQGILFYGPT